MNQDIQTPVITAGKIFAKMAAILKDVEAITKDRTNTQGQGFKYRGVDDSYNELHPLFGKHGVFCTTTVLERTQVERTSKSGGSLFYTVCKILFRFYAEDGSFVESILIGEAMDSGDKSTNKCMAIAHKYALLQAFLVPTEDDKDPDAHTHQVAPIQRWADNKPSNDIKNSQTYQSKEWKPNQQQKTQETKPPEGSEQLPRKTPGGLVEGQLKRLYAIVNSRSNAGYNKDTVKPLMQAMFGIDSSTQLTPKQYDLFIKTLETHTFDEAIAATKPKATKPVIDDDVPF